MSKSIMALQHGTGHNGSGPKPGCDYCATKPLDLASLTEDGDTLALPDGRMLRLRTEPDQDASINDYDSDGKVAWGIRGNQGERRPDGFDGSAEKLPIYDRGISMWWQPCEGMTIKRGTPEWRAERARMRDLVEYGFKGFILELCKGEDAYGGPIVIKTASVWGVDDYYPELITDLADELGVTA